MFFKSTYCIIVSYSLVTSKYIHFSSNTLNIFLCYKNNSNIWILYSLIVAYCLCRLFLMVNFLSFHVLQFGTVISCLFFLKRFPWNYMRPELKYFFLHRLWICLHWVSGALPNWFALNSQHGIFHIIQTTELQAWVRFHFRS